MDPLESRELRYFLAVAEELNFSRAAQRLHIAQPALSRAVRALEARLGSKLFHRTTRRVSLTDAGAVLKEDAQMILAALRLAEARARRATQTQRPLVVAVKPGSDGQLLNAIHQRYHAESGHLRPTVKVVGCGEQEAPLRSAAADLVYMRLAPGTSSEFAVTELLTEKRLALVSAAHPLAAAQVLQRADLAAEPVVRWAGLSGARLDYELGLDDAPHLADSVNREGPEVTDWSQLVETVAFEQAIAFVPASTALRFPRSDLVYLTVRDITPSTVALASAPDAMQAQAIDAYLRTAVSEARRPQHNAAKLA
ncbi:LysR family transcriptional regulator [Streptomyces sp. DSM 41524]|uniref:LysR family transcriptional regulator n=1 Tax=Streptomyces asiaticus subsp. ignotus TaxID=3098222 RepID=A0ABU7QAB8_9ACTN|nr:LysR family transcriptional regulator [Streptomyces sp. DSM 41524]